MARGQRSYGNGGRAAYSGGTHGAQARAVFAATHSPTPTPTPPGGTAAFTTATNSGLIAAFAA